jgi:hypothetical protein
MLRRRFCDPFVKGPSIVLPFSILKLEKEKREIRLELYGKSP